MLLGGPNSGKTHYAGQLYGRLQRNPGVLQMRGQGATPENLRILEEVLNSLEEGCAAGHTSATTWEDIQLQLEDESGRAIDLNWPDYGGEQLKAITDDRQVSEQWQTRLETSTGWVLLIRLNSETTYKENLPNLLKREGNPRIADIENEWDANARIVELLQILLHIASKGIAHRLETPRLIVLLSCYDEIETKDLSPHEVLNSYLPLVSSFIQSNWVPEAYSVWGLSSLGCLLEPDSNNDDFIDEGPEYQGWIVPPNGSNEDPDLSKPLAWLLEEL
nr:hypothetical protein [Pseudodesulfovibrio sp. JC047]